MACTQTLSGIPQDCAASMGGIKEVYIANHAGVASITVTTDKISAITMTSGATFKKYVLRKQTGSMSSNATIDATTGANFIVTDVVLPFTRMETAKRVEIMALLHAEAAVIVKDANDALWYLGYDEPVVATAADGLTGTNRADRNGYSITLQDNSKALPYEVNASVLDDIVED